MTHIKGITVKARSHNGVEKIAVGIHKKEFIDFLNSCDGEWANIDLIERFQPATNGYTHIAVKREKHG